MCQTLILEVKVKQINRHHKQRRTFSKFYRRHYELVSKFNVGLNTFLRHDLSEPEIYGDLVYKFNKIMGRTDFSNHNTLQTYSDYWKRWRDVIGQHPGHYHGTADA